MVSKDQAIGGAILIVCILAAVCYSVAIFKPDFVIDLFNLNTSELSFRIWAVTIPVFIAFIAIMFIGAWIGWTMATTPPPKPIEEITTEIEDKKEVTPEENTN
ncbi:MAG: transcriptional regulator [Candidatus Bathyarchaeota archaeon]|nr:transcriptional regulator [Candidatus Termiticorpusculum sp.]